jgi:type I restriction enzyme, S subunit
VSAWETVTLDQVTANGSEGLRRGPFGGAVKKEIFIPEGYKIYEQKHAIYGDFEVGSYYIGERHYRELRSFAVQPGDLLVSCSGTLGRVAIVPPSAKPGIINQALLRIRPKSDLVFPRFFKMFLETPELQSRLFGSAGGSAIKNVKPLDEIRTVKFKLPPLPEQRRIAEVLERAEALRTKRRAALAQLDSLTQSIFLDLFGDPASNPKELPKETLEQLTLNITDGKHGDCRPSPNSGYFFISVKDIKDSRIDYSDAREIDRDDFMEVHKRTRLEVGDVLVTNSGTIGRTAIVAASPELERTTFQKSVAIVKPRRERLEAHYLKAPWTCASRNLRWNLRGHPKRIFFWANCDGSLFVFPHLICSANSLVELQQWKS